MKMKLILLLITCTSLANSLVFNCEFQGMFWLHVEILYTCQAAIDNSDDSSHLTHVRGVHDGEKTLSDVEGLVVSAQTLIEIPRNLVKFLPVI